jgi:predicted NAD/FAD-dependent oxidoreductase
MQRRILVLTPPLPQTLELLDQCQIRLGSDADVNQLRAIQYDKCLAVLLILKNPAKIPAPGGLAIGAQSAQLQSAQLRSAQLQSAQLQWATCNFQKGISLDCHAVTLEASPEFSEEYWDDRQAGGQLLIDEAQRLGLLERQDQVDFQVHGWRYSQTRSTYPHPYYAPDAKTRAEFNLSPLILAGDAFAPKSASCSLEGSFLSAWAAAEHILKEYA